MPADPRGRAGGGAPTSRLAGGRGEFGARSRAGAGGRLASRMRKKGGKGAVLVFLLVGAAPIAATVWFFLQPEDRRQSLLDKIPSGVGSRAGVAGLSFVMLVVLAVVVLPGARATIAALARALHWFRTRPKGLRVALFPAEMVVGLAWFVAQCLFAIDAIAILGAAAAFFVYTLRIIKPDLFPSLPG